MLTHNQPAYEELYSFRGLPYANEDGLHPDLVWRYSDSDCAILASTLALWNGWGLSAVIQTAEGKCDGELHGWGCDCPRPEWGLIVHAWARTPAGLFVDVLGVETLVDAEKLAQSIDWAPNASLCHYENSEDFEDVYFISQMLGDPIPDAFYEYPELDLAEDVASYITEKLSHDEWPRKAFNRT